MILIFNFLLWSASVGAQIPANDPGMALLSSYTCGSVGSKSRQQLEGLNSLKEVVRTIQDDSACTEIGRQILGLPEIERILENLQQSNVAKAIQEQEAIISQALADLQRIDETQLTPQNSYLFPDPQILRATIQESRTELVKLRAEISRDESVANKQKYLNGIEQLNSFAEGLSSVLENPQQDCFGKYPHIRNSIAGGILGISGFFMSQPLGLVTNMAGKLLQKVISIGYNLKRKKANHLAFDEVNLIGLMSGLSCGLESLSSQRCKLLREHQLFQKIVKYQSKNDQELEKIADEKIAPLCIALPHNSTQSVDELLGWVRESQNLGIGIIGDQQTQRRQEALNAYINSSNSAKNAVNKIETNILTSDEGQKFNSRVESYNKILQLSLGNTGRSDFDDRNILPDLFSNKDAKASLNAKERNALFIRLIYPPEVSSEDTLDLSLRLKTQYEDFFRRINPTRGTPSEVPAHEMVAVFLDHYRGDLYETIRSGQLTPPISDIIDRLGKAETGSTINRNLAVLDATMSTTLKGAEAPERLESLIRNFYGTRTQQNSPYQRLRQLDDYFRNLPPIDGRVIGLYQIRETAKKIEKTLKLAEDFESKMSITDNLAPQAIEWKTLISKVSELVGANNNLGLKIANINKEIQNHYLLELDTKLKSLPPDQKNQFNEAVMLMNMDVLRSSIQVSATPSDQNIDYITAKSISQAHMKGFGNFFKDYFKTVFNELEKPDRASIDPMMKNKFCISLLALPVINSLIKEKCAKASLKSLTEEVSLNFSDHLNRPFDERACLYEDFKMKEKYFLQTK